MTTQTLTTAATYTNGATPHPPPATPPTPGNKPATFDLMNYRAEDGGILDCWHDLYNEQWMFVTGYECWYQWAGTHWEKNERQALQRQIEALMDAMNRAAAAELASLPAPGPLGDDPETAALRAFLKSMCGATKRSKARVASVEGMAQARCAVPAGTLDAGNVLNLQNGTLDLDSIELRPHDRNDRLTYVLDYGYDYAEHCPRFEQFLQEVLVCEEPDETGRWVTDIELCTLYQELLGYGLTTDTRHEVMTWFAGDGGNGKTVAIAVAQMLLGPLCGGVDFQTIGTPGNYDLADLPGRRMVFSTESERGGKVAEGWIKRIVSGERIRARPIYGKPFEFKSTAKIVWAMNDKPIIRDTSNAIWRRLKLIPFHRTFTEQDKDPDLLNKLAGELPGILNFALDGLRRLRQRGRLPESRAVAAAIDEYRMESNPVAQWLAERTTPTDAPATLASALFEDYQAWATRNGRQAMNATNFGRELKRLKNQPAKKMTGWFYKLVLQP